MAEWLYEEGIGENRAILVEDDEIVEAAIEFPSEVRAGAVVPARLSRILVPGARGIAALANGGEVLIEPLPATLTEGAAFNAEILREAIPEAGRAKLARARATDLAPRPGLSLAERIGRFTKPSQHGSDRFEAAGWSELLEQAALGEIGFPGGALRLSLTPAMSLFDVDGTLPVAALAKAGAAAAARAIRRLGITGSIGIDLPTMSGRADRQAAAGAIDALLPQPFERTAVNGFGFLQIVRRRERPSIAEIVQGDPAGAAARSLLRAAERSAGPGGIHIQAAPAVIARLESRREWIESLQRRAGTSVALRAEPHLSISAGHVHRQPS